MEMRIREYRGTHDNKICSSCLFIQNITKIDTKFAFFTILKSELSWISLHEDWFSYLPFFYILYINLPNLSYFFSFFCLFFSLFSMFSCLFHSSVYFISRFVYVVSSSFLIIFYYPFSSLFLAISFYLLSYFFTYFHLIKLFIFSFFETRTENGIFLQKYFKYILFLYFHVMLKNRFIFITL